MISQSQYNSLMSDLLNQKHALAKLRAELEGRKERMCWCCRKFRHLAHNYRNKRGEMKRKPIPQNKFEMIVSRVIQCEVGGRSKSQETRDSRGSKVFQVLGSRALQMGVPEY